MAETEFKYDVFISYSHKDEEWVRNILLPTLEKQGLKVCIDYRDFMAGKPAIINMQDASEASRHTLLVLTPGWVESEWTLYESILSRTDDPSGLQRRTIPLHLEKCKPPKFISMLSWVDFTEKKHESDAWQNLFKSLDKEVEKVEVEKGTADQWYLAHPYPMPPNFTGRVAEQKMLDDWLADDRDRLFILRALGGFGKSALAWQWINTHVNPAEWRRLVFWSFYEGDASFERFIEETLKYLKLEIPQGQRPQVDELLKAMGSQKILLIMDGFERALRAYSSMNAPYQADESHLPSGEGQGEGGYDCVNINAEFFLKGICSLPNIKSKVLMTTRLTPRAVKIRGEIMLGCREEELTAMQKEDAVEFFHKQKIKGTHAEIEAACAPYGYHPLSLRLLAGRILKDFDNPADIVVAEKLKIDGGIIQQKHHVLEVSYNSLPPHEQILLSTIACFRSPVELKTLEAIDVRADGDPLLQDDLRDLVDRGLLHFDEKNKKFDLHPIVRRYTYEQFIDKRKIHKRLVEYFQEITELKAHWVGSSWHPRRVRDISDLALCIELYHHTVQAGHLNEAYRELNVLLDILVNRVGVNQTAIELLRVFFPDGEDKPPHLELEVSRNDVRTYLANAYIQSGQPRRALLLLEAIGNLDNKELTGVLTSLGALRLAQDYLQRRIKLLSSFISWDILEKVFSLCELGNLYSCRGEWEAAEQEFSTVLTTQEVKHIEEQSSMWAFRAQHALLMIRDPLRSSTENRKSAIIYAQQALELAEEEKYFPSERDLIRAHWLLGATYLANNDSQQAEHHLSDALTRCRAINLVEVEANILLDLARLSFDYGLSSSAQDKLKHFENAKSLAEEALIITERCGYVLQGADVNLFLAELALTPTPSRSILAGLPEGEGRVREIDKAKEYAETALKLARCDGPPYYYKVAYEEAERLLEKLK